MINIKSIESNIQKASGKALFNIFWNLNRKCWSVRYKSKVIHHLDQIIKITNPKFHVSELGRQRVLKEKTKNIHAWVKADNFEVFDRHSMSKEDHASRFDEIYYAPFILSCFINRRTKVKIEKADSIILFHKCVYFNN
jgi:hypothetical protein